MNARKKIKILIVEDEFILTLELKTGLEAMGFEVCAPVASGREALEAVAGERPDLAVIDVNLVGDMNGLELAAELKKSFAVPFIFITGIADEHTSARIRELEPLASLIKPIHARDIHDLIRDRPELSGESNDNDG